jgi:hypothetical protein
LLRFPSPLIKPDYGGITDYDDTTVFTLSASLTSYTAINLNQCTAVGSASPTYDGNGNLTYDGAYTITLDELLGLP